VCVLRASLCVCVRLQYEDGIDIPALFAPDKLLRSSNDDYDDVRVFVGAGAVYGFPGCEQNGAPPAWEVGPHTQSGG
jgi:hypothetical protein